MSLVWLGLALLCAGCAHSGGSLELLAPFSDDSVVGEITATWSAGGATRDVGSPVRTERQVEFRVEALNLLSDRLYVALHHFRLMTADGATAESAASVECTLAAGERTAVLTGSLWIGGSAAAIREFRVDHLAVPLSERGRAFYREFLLRQRPDAMAAIDAELAADAAAASCRTVD